MHDELARRRVYLHPIRWTSLGLSLLGAGYARAAMAADVAAAVDSDEIEGRIPQIEGDPSRLGTLARSHARLRPDAPAWVGLRVVRHKIVVVDRVPTGEVETEVVAEWAQR